MKLLSRYSLGALVVATVLVFLATACGGDKDEPNGATASGGATGSIGTPAPPPPGAFTVDEMTDLSMTDVDGFVRQPVALISPSRTGIRYDEANEGLLQAQVTIGPCTPDVCWDLVGITEQQGKELKAGLPERNLKDDDLIFEYGTSELLPGYVGFYTYSRSFVQAGATIATLNGYSLLYHDGSNWISIVVTPQNAPLPDSPQELLRQMDQEQGETAARAFFEAFAADFDPQ